MAKQERQKRLKVFPRRSEGNGSQKGFEILVTFALEHKKGGERRRARIPLSSCEFAENEEIC